jgi:anti-sigma-K factor RskA
VSAAHSDCAWSASVAAYVLGALDGAEQRAFEAHLADCARCRQEVAGLSPAVELLATGVDQVEPPGELRRRLMAQVNAEAELLRTGGPAPNAQAARGRRRPRWRRTLRLPIAAAALTAALLIGLGIAGGVLLAGDNEPARRVITAQVARGAAPEARARLVVAHGVAQLGLRAMPAPPAGKVYQVWLTVPGMRGPQPTNVLFSVRRGGTATIAVPLGHPRPRELLVTAEPDGGSDHPTSSPVIAARLT